MRGSEQLSLLTETIFAVLFGVALVDLARRRDLPRLEVAALFATVGIVSLVGVVNALFHVTPAWVGTITILLLLAQPYALVRLLGHFRRVPRLTHALALAALAASWSAVVLDPPPLTPLTTLVLIATFACVEGYAAVSFVRAAFASRGVARRRLALAATGSGLLGAAILAAGIGAVAQPAAPVAGLVAGSLGLGSAVCYFLSFAPPRWLRRAWQFNEFRRYIDELTGKPPEERVERALDNLAPAATKALGGKGAVTFVWDAATERLWPHIDAESAPALAAAPAGAPIREIALGPESHTFTAAWRERRPIPAGDPRRWCAALHAIAAAFGGAGGALIAPLVSGDRSYGLLVVVHERGPLFVEDDLAVLGLLSEEAALAVAQAQFVTQLRQQNAALAEASHLKSTFLATMSHELRTPLNAIIGFSELLLDESEDGYPRDVRTTYLETIHDSGQHLLGLINDVLDLSKIEAGRMELRLDRLRLADVVDSVLSTVAPLARRKEITLEAHTEGAGGVVADDGKVRQVLYNLLSNAIKFTPSGGRVWVDTERGPSEVRITVSDTGIGIAPEDQERIFHEFQQLDVGSARRYEGTGLGLALTRRLTELHGGRVWVESAVGKGSRFHFTLPLQVDRLDVRGTPPADRADVETPPAAESPESSTDAPVVLVVEDEPAAAEVLRLYLERGGYRPHFARDGREVIELARTLHPAAITLDVLLPGADGWDILHALKEDRLTRDIPVVVISVVDDRSRGYALGAADYFVKPVDRQALLTALSRHASVKRVLVVDDDAASLDLLDATLAPAGYRVLRAGGGAEGIRLARRARPDAIVLDLLMPEVSGFDVLTAVRADPALSHVPILVLTAKDLTPEDKALLNERVACVLQKGSSAGVDLMAWLATLTSQRREP